MMVVVNVNLKGKLEQFVEQYIQEGYATSKAEVIRSVLIKYFEGDKKSTHKDINDDLKFAMAASSKTLKKIWDNDKEEKAWSKYY